MALTLDGYVGLEVTHDLGMTWQQVSALRALGQMAPTIVDFPNWDQAGPGLGLMEIDPATGAATDRPLCRPAIPLTMDGLATLPMRLMSYLCGDEVISEALADDHRTRRPFSKDR